MLVLWILLGILVGLAGGYIGWILGALLGAVIGIILDLRFRRSINSHKKEAEKRLEQIEGQLDISQPLKSITKGKLLDLPEQLEERLEQNEFNITQLFEDQIILQKRLKKIETELGIKPKETSTTFDKETSTTITPVTEDVPDILASTSKVTAQATTPPQTPITISNQPVTDPPLENIPSKQTTQADTSPLEYTSSTSHSSSYDSYHKENIPSSNDTRGPNLVSKFFRLVLTFFSEGNSLARIGTILLLIGLGFLIQYAARQSLQLGILSAALTGITLLGFGWVLRRSRRIYSLSLQGGGLGVLYLSLFASLKLLPLPITFSALILVGILAAALSVVQNAPSLAVLATLGGFLSPVLATFNADLHVPLFSYYLLLNIGIATIAWFKAWRWLNLIGFIFTFSIGGIWGGLNYKSELFYSTEPFLIAFALLYIVIAILYAGRQPPKLKGLVDGVIVFGLPVVAFSLQAALVQNTSSMALSSSLSAAFYLSLSGLLFWLGPRSMHLLSEAFLAIGLAFVTITFPLAFGASWTGTGWALEGIGLLWVGLRQNSFWMRLSGMLVQIAAAVALFWNLWWNLENINSYYFAEQIFIFGAVILALAGIMSAGLLYHAKKQDNESNLLTSFIWEAKLSPFFLGYGLIWWLIAGVASIDLLLPREHDAMVFITFVSLTSLACVTLSPLLKWTTLRRPALILILMLLYIHLATNAWINGGLGYFYPSENFGWLVWPLAILIHRFVLKDCAALNDNRDWWQGSLWLSHAANLWLVTWLLVQELPRWLERISLIQPYNQILVEIGPYLVLSFVIFFVSSKHIRKLGWFGNYQKAYLTGGLIPLATILWILAAINYINYASGTYTTYLNPLDIAHGLTLVALFIWYLRLFDALKQQSLTSFALALFASNSFIWIYQFLLNGNEYSYYSSYTSTALMLSVSHLFSAYLAKISVSSIKQEANGQSVGSSNAYMLGIIANSTLSVGLFWLVTAVFVQTNSSVLPTYALAMLIGFLTVIALSCHFVGKVLRWPTLQGMGLLLLPALIIAVIQFPENVLSSWAILTWILAFVTYYWLLKQALNLPAAGKLFDYFAFAHSVSLWFITYLLASGFTQFFQQTLANNDTWSLVGWGTAMLIITAMLSSEKFRNLPWLKPYKERLFTLALTPLSILLWLWLMSANFNSATALPLSYIPILNPLDLTQAFSLLVLIWWASKCRRKFSLAKSQKNTLTVALIVAGISWPSVMVLRSVHHLLEVPYTFEALYGSSFVQTALSIFWTSFALVAMVIAARRKVYLPWLIGAGLLTLVVTKLFLVDLSKADTLARVISFIAVGVLLLLIGYVAPVPPIKAIKNKK